MGTCKGTSWSSRIEGNAIDLRSAQKSLQGERHGLVVHIPDVPQPNRHWTDGMKLGLEWLQTQSPNLTLLQAS